MTTDPQTYCDICDADVETVMGICADCWQTLPDPETEDYTSVQTKRCFGCGYQNNPLDAPQCLQCGAAYPETHFDAAREEG